MADPDTPAASGNSGRHRAPDGEAQTAYIPRITDASPDGVPGGPLAPPVGLGTPPPTPTAHPAAPPSQAAHPAAPPSPPAHPAAPPPPPEQQAAPHAQTAAHPGIP